MLNFQKRRTRWGTIHGTRLPMCLYLFNWAQTDGKFFPEYGKPGRRLFNIDLPRGIRLQEKIMLRCCSVNFAAQTKIVLPARGYLYRCLEYGVCPRCGATISRFIRQDSGYDISVVQRSGIKAQRELIKAKKERERADALLKQGTLSKQHYYYGTFRLTRRKDERGNRVYIQQQRNFNNQAVDLYEVKTKYYSLYE